MSDSLLEAIFAVSGKQQKAVPEVLNEAKNKTLHRNMVAKVTGEHREIQPDSSIESKHLAKAEAHKSAGDMHNYHNEMVNHHVSAAEHLQSKVDKLSASDPKEHKEALAHLGKMYAHESAVSHHKEKADQSHPDWKFHIHAAMKHTADAEHYEKRNPGDKFSEYYRKKADVHMGKANELYHKSRGSK